MPAMVQQHLEAPSRRSRPASATAVDRRSSRPSSASAGRAAFRRPGSAPVRREKSSGSADASSRLPPPEFSVHFGGWKQRLAQADAQRVGAAQASGRSSPPGLLASVDEAAPSPMVTRSRSMFERPGSAERPAAERAWQPRVAEEWSQSLVGKQRFRSNWLRCVGAYRDLQLEFPDFVLPLGTPPTPHALAAHLRLFDMLIDLAKEAGEAPGCNQDEHNMLCAIRTTCLAALYVPPESSKATQLLRPELNADHSDYDERQMCCSRSAVLETQIMETAAERDDARRRISELEAALEEETVERARLQSSVSKLEAGALISEMANREGELENKAQGHQIRRLELALEGQSESAKLRRMQRELDQANLKVKKAMEIEASSVGRVKQAEDCVAEMQAMVTEGNAQRTVLGAALAAAEESSAELRAHIETLNATVDRVAQREERSEPPSFCAILY